jgi:hypothetical protein
MLPRSQPLRPLTSPAGPAVMSAAASYSAVRRAAAWIISNFYGSALAVCEVDLHVLLSDALARASPDSSIRVEVWQPEPPALHDTE